MTENTPTDSESPFAHPDCDAENPEHAGDQDADYFDQDEADEANLIPNFIPVPVRGRADGWTPHRQIAFVEALAQTGCVEQAARCTGMSSRSAYKLRQHQLAAEFRNAWDAAIHFAMQRLADAALSRAIHGISRPIIHRGEIIGERRYYDERLTQFLLTRRDPARFGRSIDQSQFDEPQDSRALQLAGRSIMLMKESMKRAKKESDVSRTSRTSSPDGDEMDGDESDTNAP